MLRGAKVVLRPVARADVPAIRADEAAGFAVDGVMRDSPWVEGSFVDETCMSTLAADVSRTSARS
jgi:RimJ/RimL family protein N-acetyltransferase